MAKTQRVLVKESIIEALDRKGKRTAYSLSLVDDYISLWDLKRQAIAQIKAEGVSVEYQNGSSQSGMRANPAMAELNRIIRSMDLILRSLGIRPSDMTGKDDGVDL